MQIRSSNPALLNSSARLRAAKPEEQQKDVKTPFKERVVTDAIIGASLGTMAGERIGEVSFVGAAAFLGYTLGMTVGNPDIGSVVGAGIGAGAGYLAENRFGIGKTIGGGAGFLAGSVVGGVTGVVVGGTAAVLNSDLF